MLSVTDYRFDGRKLVNNKLKGTVKEAGVVSVRYCSHNCLRCLRKKYIKLSQVIWHPKKGFENNSLKTSQKLLFISVFNQLDAQNLFYNKFNFMPLYVSSTCAKK
jgi:hypothetical protein